VLLGVALELLHGRLFLLLLRIPALSPLRYLAICLLSALPSSIPAHSSSLPHFPLNLSILLSTSDVEESDGNGKDKDRSGSQLHFVGSLPFANMITNTTDMSTYGSAVRTGSMIDQASTHDGPEQGGVSASLDLLSTSISDETGCQTDTDCSASENAESGTSSGDALVRLANSQLLQKRREDELRAQLAGNSLPPLLQCSVVEPLHGCMSFCSPLLSRPVLSYGGSWLLSH
jgi:hypothetical protein